TLLHILDKTCTPMGGRLLNRWMVMVLKDLEKIQLRQTIVEFFLKNDEKRNFVRENLEKLSDLERMAAKISTGKITPRQLLLVAQSLEFIQEIKSKLIQDKKIGFLIESIKDWEEVYQNLFQTLSAEPPHQLVKGNVFAEGISEELDRLRNLQNKGKDYLEDLRIRETNRTGIPSIKVSFNNVFGYYIEIRNTHKDKIPEDWIRKQTLVNAERYITEELKEYETQILGAEEKILSLETQLFQNLLNEMLQHLDELQKSAQIIAQLDVLSSFAELAENNHYTKPEINESSDLVIEDGRHPVIEKQLKIGETYIANSVSLVPNEQQIIMITGPNMSGKS